MTAYINKKVTIQAVFKVDGALTNPTTVTVTLRDPGGNDSNPTATNSSTGVYTFDFTPDEYGVWRYLVEGSGAVVTREWDSIDVIRTPFD